MDLAYPLMQTLPNQDILIQQKCCKYPNRYPIQLQGKVHESQYVETITAINKVLRLTSAINFVLIFFMLAVGVESFVLHNEDFGATPTQTLYYELILVALLLIWNCLRKKRLQAEVELWSQRYFSGMLHVFRQQRQISLAIQAHQIPNLQQQNYQAYGAQAYNGYQQVEPNNQHQQSYQANYQPAAPANYNSNQYGRAVAPGPTFANEPQAFPQPQHHSPALAPSFDPELQYSVAENQGEPSLTREGEAPRESSLPPGWRAAVDPNTGQHFYLNDHSQITQWERPV